jgi:phage tail-like protein
MPEDAYANCRFYVEIDGRKEAAFTEVSGLQVEITVTEHEEGGNNGFVYRLPGRAKIGNLTLKRGVTRSNNFLKWNLEIAGGSISRRNVTLLMYDTAGKELMRWNFINAYPVKWVGPQFAADKASPAIETLELAHEGMTVG